MATLSQHKLEEHYKTHLSTIQQSALDYINADLHLVPLIENDKRPCLTGWNERKQCVSTTTQVQYLTRHSIGIAHAFSGTCAIDVDNYDKTASIFAEHGIDLDSLLGADDAVQIRSGRANRAKLLYRLTEPLPTIQHAVDGVMAFELRCATSDSKTVQDVLPPSIHPDTGKPYEWFGDWRNIPAIPDQLLTLWTSLQTSPKPPKTPSEGQAYQRSNTSVVHPVLERAETTSETFTGKLDSARYHKLLTGQQSQMKMLKWMGFRNIDELFKRGKLRVCSVIGDPDNNPSASLFVTPDGAVVFTDYRGVHKKKSLMLPEVLSYMVNGKGFTVGERVANATWGVRLMIESGVLSEADVRFPGCDGMSEKHLAVWKSIKLLYQCRWRYSDHEGSPIALGREFLAKWSGQSERQTRYLVMDLLKSKHLKTGSKVGTRRYYLPNRRQK